MSAAFYLRRLEDDGKATLGELRGPDQTHLCWTLENTWANNERRVSCIPPGRYPLTVREVGEWNKRLATRFPNIHAGAIEIADVPGRSAILIHPGNTHTDTLGCILPGDTRTRGPDDALAVGQSAIAYQRVYPGLLAAARDGGFIDILDLASRTHGGTVV